MDIHISRDSDVPVHEQIAAQLVLLIGTGGLEAGASLPSVRALAQRLGVHRNTVSRAYHDLTLERLAEKRAGRRLSVRAVDAEGLPGRDALDSFLNVTLAEARRRGYSPSELHARMRSRLLASPPDHVLVLSDDAGMRMLLPRELRERCDCPVDACTPDDLRSQPERRIGALVITPQGHLPRIRPVLTPEHSVVAITYSSADAILEGIRRLKTPSLVAVVSVSAYFLEMARGLLAPAVGRRHSMRGCLMVQNNLKLIGAADVVLCDSITYPIVRPRYTASTVFLYRLISTACLDEITSMVASRSSQAASALPQRASRRQKSP